MTDSTTHVLRIPRSDEEGSFVLARVSSSGQASKPLNARIVATEGEAPYSLSLRHDRIDKLCGPNAPCTSDEWEGILRFLLLGQGWVDNIDATATVKEESAVTIAVRKRVQNITQHLGTLSLAYDEDEGIELFEWCGEAVDSRAKAQQGLAEATAKQTALQTAVDDLKAQLDEFLTTKDADETIMLEKFCTLLNEKKLKIRVQQRMLAKAADDDSHAEAVAEIKEEEEEDEEPKAAAAPKSTTARGGRLGKVGSGSKSKAAPPGKRGAKRSAAAAAVSEPDDGSDEDEFEQTATRSGARGKGKGKAPAASTSHDMDSASEDLDESTDSGDAPTESDDDGDAEPMDEDSNDAEPEKTTAAPVPEEITAPPPRRVLAFGKSRSAADGGASSAAARPPAPAPAPKAAPPAANDSDTDSDDEL
ncbi:mitotic apparatus protein p62 [Ophiostoma piceae UAMH 11346]|uniref:Mitotic apparatus protein p62 n=1 Tax=Ophiostoma piceae (strain UAMH 11346) TaxID=1262450 RepID=S3C3S2_OPHP1|nr:mitotic apparatus protein p62 [Ophiostoma piceae UAMH 11346]